MTLEKYFWIGHSVLPVMEAVENNSHNHKRRHDKKTETAWTEKNAFYSGSGVEPTSPPLAGLLSAFFLLLPKCENTICVLHIAL